MLDASDTPTLSTSPASDSVSDSVLVPRQLIEHLQADLKFKQTKIEALSFEIARLKRWRFGSSAESLAARRLIESGQPLMVSKSVILELEWVMRGYYSFAQVEVASVMRHLLEQAHITVEDRDAVEQAISNSEAGIDFADALHHTSYKSCDSVATFDDRKFTQRARMPGLAPAVVVLSCKAR